MTLQGFMDHVKEQLAPLYPAEECRAMAVRLLREIVQGYKGYEHFVEPQRELETFQLEEAFAGSMQLTAASQSSEGSDAPCDHFSLEKFLLSAVGRLSTGEPFQYVLGYEWFCGHRFNVAPGVLIPRPETEELVNLVCGLPVMQIEGKGIASVEYCPERGGSVQATEAGLVPSPKILDICTGSGCIAWSIAAAKPQAEVWGCDISQAALQMARSQNVFNPDGTPAQVNFFECDILSPQAQHAILSQCADARTNGHFCSTSDVIANDSGCGMFDIIVSNPPYVCESEKLQMRTNVLDHEPHLALFVPDEDPLRFYRAIAQLSGRLLKPGGVLLFEINERFGEETKKILQDLGFENCRVMQDIFGKERMVAGSWASLI